MKKEATFLISSLAGGGAEGVCVNIANGLANQGWEIDLLVLNLNNAAYINRVSEKVNLVSLNINHARYAFNPIRKYLQLKRPKKIVVFNYELSVLLVFIRMVTRGNFKIISRNISNLSQNNKMIEGRLRKKVVPYLINNFYCKVDYVINQCNEMESGLLDIFPSLSGKTSVIYNPVNKLVEDSVKDTDFSTLEKEDYFLCIGRLEPTKAFHYAIEAFSIYVKKNPESNTRLKILGIGSLYSELIETAKHFSVEERVDFEGFKEDIIPYYIKAKATLLTSLYEGFPNVLVESITLGTPVIAFNCPSGPSEIIKEGVNGYLIEYQNTSDLADALQKTDKFLSNKVKSTANTYSLDKSVIEYSRIISLF